jgi:transcriptional regulator GlxA family with amidase domain
MPAEALLNCDVPLHALWGDAAHRIDDELDATTSIGEGLRVLQTSVEQHHTEAADSLVSAAITQLRRKPHTGVRALGDRLGISERQLLRRFSAAVGYGPKTLARVIRFQRVMRLLYGPLTREWDLARLAAETGYADHAHLTREVLELSGFAPSALRSPSSRHAAS